MKVILKEEIDNLGNAGDLVMVKDGYARNYLIPRQLAIRADQRNVKELEHHQRALERRRVKLKVVVKGHEPHLSEITLQPGKYKAEKVSFARPPAPKGAGQGAMAN